MNNIESFQDFIVGAFDRVAYPLTFLILLTSGYNLYEIEYPRSNINSKITSLYSEVEEVRNNAYHNSMYDILSLSEKSESVGVYLQGNTLAKFQRICSDKKFVKYVKDVPGEPFLGDVKEACSNIADLRNSFYKKELDQLYAKDH